MMAFSQILALALALSVVCVSCQTTSTTTTTATTATTSSSSSSSPGAVTDLSDFPGTWVGTGYNLVAVPNNASSTQEGFDVKQANYTETTSVTVLNGPTPNRGAGNFQQVPTYMYETRALNNADNTLLHAENGQYLTFFDAANKNLYKNQLVRLTSIPHGNTILANGNYTVVSGQNLHMTYPTIDAFPISQPNGGSATAPPPPGLNLTVVGTPTAPFEINQGPYVQQYPPAGFINKLLAAGTNFTAADAAAGTTTTIVKYVQYNLSSTYETGGINFIPFLNINARPAEYHANFWLQTLSVKHKSTGATKTVLQLQYFQFCFLDFSDAFFPVPGNIRWPHVQVATLRKVTS